MTQQFDLPRHGHVDFTRWPRYDFQYVIIVMTLCVLISFSDRHSVAQSIRFATFNVSLYGKRSGQVVERISDGEDRQARRLASIIQTIKPDILLINEIDFDSDSATLNAFCDLFLETAGEGTDPIAYPFRRAFPSNTGVDSKLDLNHDERLGSPNDAWGYGVYPGQYGFSVVSKFPIDVESIRTFQRFRWSHLPSALKPIDPSTKRPYYPADVWPQLRLSSKNHVDVPIRIDKRTVHLLASHPTPPVFDGPADHNGCRNHDEIRFWLDYVGTEEATYLVDDNGNSGGLSKGRSFVIAGDLNADPKNGDGRQEAIQRLLNDPRTVDARPKASGFVEAAGRAGSNDSLATADFGRNGRMRVDYVIPSSDLSVVGSGVFWPTREEEGFDWITATDHRLVWVDIRLGADGGS